MANSYRSRAGRPGLAIAATASTLLWGVIEFMALCRSRWAERDRRAR